MDAVKQNLEDIYKIFIERDQPFAFFRGLSEYLDYVFATPELKVILDAQISERNVMYKRVLELEEKSCTELEQVKQKLLSVLKKQKIPRNSMKRLTSFGLPQYG